MLLLRAAAGGYGVFVARLPFVLRELILQVCEAEVAAARTRLPIK